MKVVKTFMGTILAKMSGLNKSKKDFLSYCICMFLSIQGKLNFLQLARYGSGYAESSCGLPPSRNHFEEYLDFSTFNTELILAKGGGAYLIALDMSYVRKAGKSTDGVGKYWSGCSSRAEWGLEAGILAAIDIENHTAWGIDAVQNPNKEERQALGISYLDYCVSVVDWNKENLLRLSKYLVVDAYFTKKEFIIPVRQKTGLHLIGRLREDANLRYLHESIGEKRRGRPKKFGEKLERKNVDLSKWVKVQEDENQVVYEKDLWAVFLKTVIRVAYVIYKKQTGKQASKLYFSTDTCLSAVKIQHYYQLRFQQEFLIRDAKQIGLEHCQARSTNKTEFHWNAVLTTVNVAKATYFLALPKEKREAFSIRNIKKLYANKLMIDRIFDILPNGDELKKNNPQIEQLYLWGLRT